MMRPSFIALALLVAGLFSAPSIAAAGENQDEATMTLERGIEHYLHLDFPMRRLTVGDSKMLDVSVVDGSNLRILGLASGRTNFSVWREGASTPVTYRVIVSENLSALTEQLAKIGSAESARLSEVDGKIVLEGKFGDRAARDDAKALAKFVTGKDVLDLSDVVAQESVQVEVEVVSVSRTALRSFGINFAKLDHGISVASTAPNTLQSFALNPNGNSRLDVNATAPIASAFNLLLGSPQYNALAVISALEGSNFAQTLAQPTLVVRSGEKAQFLVGGEIPIPVPQGNATSSITIEYKRFGVSLYIEPTILKGRRVALRIKPVVSELDFTNAIALQGYTVPAIKTRETETTVEVVENEPFIIAGLMFDSGGTIHEKVPYLGDIPVLGKFFQRARETHDEQELVVAVTPRLVTSASQSQIQRARVRSDLMHIGPNEPALAGNAPAPGGAGSRP